MNVVTMVGGVATNLNALQLAAHINGKATHMIGVANLNACANDILAHPGGNGAGGALGGGLHHHGAAIYHTSHNMGGAANGCSVFFCDAGGGHAKILAVGAHVGQAGPGHPVYDLDWVAPGFGAAGWNAGAQIVL